MSSSLKVCILAGSDPGGGSTIKAVLGFIKHGYVSNTEIACVVTRRPDAGVIAIARKHGLPYHRIFVLPRTEYPTSESVDAAILEVCTFAGANAIWQSGWLNKTGKSVIKEFAGRIWNQHPGALSPNAMQYEGHRMDFGGRGMHGIVPVAAALYYAQTSKNPWAQYAHAVAHMLTEHEEDIDGGKVIGERRVPIRPDDTPESLQARLKRMEQSLHANMMSHFATYRCFFQPSPLFTTGGRDDMPLLRAARIKALEIYGAKK